MASLHLKLYYTVHTIINASQIPNFQETRFFDLKKSHSTSPTSTARDSTPTSKRPARRSHRASPGTKPGSHQRETHHLHPPKKNTAPAHSSKSSLNTNPPPVQRTPISVSMSTNPNRPGGIVKNQNPHPPPPSPSSSKGRKKEKASPATIEKEIVRCARKHIGGVSSLRRRPVESIIGAKLSRSLPRSRPFGVLQCQREPYARAHPLCAGSLGVCAG